MRILSNAQSLDTVLDGQDRKLLNPDNATIKINSTNNKAEAVAIKTAQNGTRKIWEGTLEQYEAIENKDDETYYYITDDSDYTQYQKKLVSGSNIKTINNQSILGSGNLNISGGGGSQNVWFATCSTANSTQTKVAMTSTEDFRLEAGSHVTILMSKNNTYAGKAKLDVDNTGAKDLVPYVGASLTRYFWRSNEVISVVYDGTQYVMIDSHTADVTCYGITKLSAATDSTATDLAATPSAVKSAYDLAASKQDALVSGTNIKTINNQSLLGSGNINIGNSTYDGTNLFGWYHSMYNGENVTEDYDITPEMISQCVPGAVYSWPSTVSSSTTNNAMVIGADSSWGYKSGGGRYYTKDINIRGSYYTYAYDENEVHKGTWDEESGGLACFAAGTKVYIKDGLMNIEDIKVNDEVMAANTYKNIVEPYWIKDIIHHTVNTIIKIYVNNEIIEVTEGHQFWAIEKGRTRAADLESGDLLVDYQGNTFEITKVEKIENISIEVYEIMVEDARNYFVGNGHYQVFNEIIS